MLQPKYQVGDLVISKQGMYKDRIGIIIGIMTIYPYDLFTTYKTIICGIPNKVMPLYEEELEELEKEDK